MDTAVETSHGIAERARFRAMSEGTAEDWQVIARDYLAFAAGLPDRVLAHLRLLEGDFGGFPVCRLEHSRQTATRAHRDGRDERYVVMALLHDIGDTLGSYNHPDVAAAIVKPFVDEETHWICQ
ncbi:MAG: HD domain-containing protein, partial [Methylobacterium sp.]